MAATPTRSAAAEPEDRFAGRRSLLVEEHLAELARLLTPGRAALALGGLIVGLCLLAAGVQDVFELGRALSVSSAFSALLVAVAGAGAWLAGRTEARESVLVAAFALLAADELLSVHDRLDSTDSGIGVVAYALVVCAALVSVALTLGRRPGAARLWLGAGAVAWACLLYTSPSPRDRS